MARKAGHDTLAKGLDDLIAKEGLKGEVLGMTLVINLPRIVTEDFEEQLIEIREALKDEHESKDAS